MRVLFAGSPGAALPTLKALQHSGHDLVGVVTQPPRPYGRSRTLRDTPVADFAQQQEIPVFTPETAEALLQVVSTTKPDIAIVVAFGRILTPEVLDAIPGGWWNVHFSLLPEFRGASPVAHTILTGKKVTGVTLFRIVPELDAGPIAAARTFPVTVHETAGTLLSKLSTLAPELVLEFLKNPEGVVLREQEGPVSLAPKFPPQFGALHLSQSLDDVYQHFRSVTPEPGAFVYRADTGLVVKILSAWADPDYHHVEPGQILKTPMGILLGTATMPLVLERVHPAGKKPMAAEDWYRGLPEGASIVVGSP
jgi:methionyl-tRNA formyltransferase